MPLYRSVIVELRRRTTPLPYFARAVALVVALPVLTQCEAWDDGPPPARAASAAPDPNAPLPPGPPIPPSGGDPQGAAGAAPYALSGAQPSAQPDDGTKYSSGEVSIGADTDSYADNDPAALSDFHAPLDPYGTWSDDATYGTVWVPAPSAVGPDFTPYVSSGHWAYDDDYVWVSDYSWGWAPFHYGRWVFVDGRGWAWIPGREYRGAWVNWSVDDGYSYLGWAPMGPSFVWFGGAPVVYGGYWGPRWAYVRRGEVFAPRVGARVVVGPSAVAIGARMRPFSAEGRLGPPPAKFGYSPAQVPRVSGSAAVNVNRAQEFAHPSTARSLGASAPAAARIESRPSVGASQARGPLVQSQQSPHPTFSTPARTGAPPVTSAPRSVAPSNVEHVQSAPARVPASPSMGGARPGGTAHGSGGHHR
jgi:hypothetical protein